MPDYLMHDPSLFHGDPPFDAEAVQAAQTAAQGLAVATHLPEGESPSGDGDAAEAPADAAQAPAYDDLTVEQLREIMRERDLTYAGLNKADLIETLEADDES